LGLANLARVAELATLLPHLRPAVTMTTVALAVVKCRV
jgi:hypothetical protein